MEWRVLENAKVLKFGQGAISKNAQALYGFLAADLLFAIFGTHDEHFRFISLLLLPASYILYYVASFAVLKWFPYHALAEGAQLAELYRARQGVMGQTEVADVPAIANPDRPVPHDLTGDTE